MVLGSPSSRYLIKSEEIMKGYPLPSNENYPGPKTLNVSGLPDFLSVASIRLKWAYIYSSFKTNDE